MEKKIVLKYKNKKIKITAENCNFIKKFTGLMFSRREKAKILLFEFENKGKIPIHSFYVFYKFLALWTDKEGKIVDMKIMEPFTPLAYSIKPAFNLVEIPINRHYKKIICSIVGNSKHLNIKK